MVGCGMVKKLLLTCLIILFVPLASHGATFSDNFDGYANLAAVNAAGWSADAGQVSLVDNASCRGGKCLKIDISSSGTQQILTRTLNESEVYIRFYAKRTGFGTTGGNKFLKLFGERTGDNYANITFGQVYASGRFDSSNSGDGSGVTNDTVCDWHWYDHAAVCTQVREIVPPGTLTMADDTWYAFEFHIYPNTDGNYDAVIQAWVDNTLRYHYTGVRMRNDANVRNFTYLSFVDYVGAQPDQPYSIWIDDVVVATSGPIGILDGGGNDSTPDQFSFTDVTGAALSTQYTSDNVTVLGIDNTTTLALTGTGCEYSINGAAFATADDNVTLNDNVALRVTSSGSYSTAKNCMLNLGGVSDTYSVTTEAAAEDPVAPRMRAGSMAGGWK